MGTALDEDGSVAEAEFEARLTDRNAACLTCLDAEYDALWKEEPNMVMMVLNVSGSEDSDSERGAAAARSRKYRFSRSMLLNLNHDGSEEDKHYDYEVAFQYDNNYTKSGMYEKRDIRKEC